MSKFVIDGKKITGLDAASKTVFSHEYTQTGEKDGRYYLKSDDGNEDEFKYFLFWGDTPAETYHLEFRYSKLHASFYTLFSVSNLLKNTNIKVLHPPKINGNFAIIFDKTMYNVTLCALGLCGATLIGTVIGFFIKELPHKWNDTVLGFCAGLMLAAAVVGLIMPSVKSASNWWIPMAGVAVGALFLNLLDFFMPHLHKITGLDENEQHVNNSTINHVLLFVLAVAIHKFPEGMASGVGFNDAEHISNAWGVTFGIALQNVPEGMVVVSPLLLLGVSKLRTFVISVIIGCLEIAGVLTGYFLGGISAMFLPFMLAFAGGAMLYVVSDEMIPETHAHGFQKQATYALLMGVMVFLMMEG